MFVNFMKMHSLGNDFVIIDLISQQARLEPKQIQRIADRHLGIGCDQVITLEPPIQKDHDFYYHIYNQDGSEVEQCGNGARCAARYFLNSGFCDPMRKTLTAGCLGGVIKFQFEDNGIIRVNIGYPVFALSNIPFDPKNESPKEGLFFLEQQDQKYEFFPLSMGNPHAVLQVENIDTCNLEQVGPWLSNHPQFPQRTNVEFMQVLNEHHILLRVFERGVGETLACGSGACAAAVAGIRMGILKSPVEVTFSLGSLTIDWPDENSTVHLSGLTNAVFSGRFRI